LSYLYSYEYSLIDQTGGDLVSPEQFGMHAGIMHTGCYRGFYATYELAEDVLYLRKLTLIEESGNYLPIGGVVPEKAEFRASYQGLNEKVLFTGKLRLARDFIREEYVHQGYQAATAFRTVLDITLKEGRIVEIKDRSQDAEKKRNESKQSRLRKILRRVAGKSDLNMNLE